MKTPRFLLAACILLALALTFSCSDDDSDILAKSLPEPEYCLDFVYGTKIEHFGKEKEQFCDKRDGNLYVKVTIGTQTWMAENLNYMMYNSECAWDTQYNEEGEEIGCGTSRIYPWRSAMGACPIGWRLPNDDDWLILANYAGGQSGAGAKLKAQSGWSSDGINTDNGNGTDDYGFSVLPHPYGNGTYVNYWSATARDDYGASFWGAGYNTDYWRRDALSKNNKFVVRCLLGDDNGVSEPYRDIDLVATRSTPMTDKRDGRYKEYKTVTIGTTTWMAQNLNYAAEGSKCIDNRLFELTDSRGRGVVDEDTPYCDTYGRLYDGPTAINACPAGWRLPTSDEFASLGFNIVKLKATRGWDYKGRNGTDDYGLAFLPGGNISKILDKPIIDNDSTYRYIYYGNKTHGSWWGRNESENGSKSVGFYIRHDMEYTFIGISSNDIESYTGGYFSIRCVRNK